jgi:hypothetical protein
VQQLLKLINQMVVIMFVIFLQCSGISVSDDGLTPCYFVRFSDGARHGALFEALNGQKKNIVIDFKNQNGSKILKQLIKSYDVLVEGNRPGVMKRLGIGYEELQKENPRLIYCSITGYGETGPYNRSLTHSPLHFISSYHLISDELVMMSITWLSQE